ncbi:MAG: type II toxin-antitoxin system Phd/YefM family antitoxin [Pelagimonas sp.]|jgi:prevent-host-death family protein|nr:type II toxin-antitoxin system Phd/YefM family antitoxin [Pelagimonas sp.]
MVWTLQDAKNKFSAVVDAALAGTPQKVSRRGKPAVVVLSADDYQRLLNSAVETRESFTDHLLAFPGPEIERAQVSPRDVEF